MSEPPAKKHPWAKYQARPVAPRPFKGRAAPEVLAPKKLSVVPVAVPAKGAGTVKAVVPAVVRGASPAPRPAPAAKGGEPARTPKAIATKPEAAPKAKGPDAARGAKPGAAVVAPKPVPVSKSVPELAAKPEAKSAPEAAPDPKKPAAPKTAPITAELADSLAQMEGLETAPGWPMAFKKRVRPAGQGRLAWLGYGVKDSARNYRANARRLRTWWRGWRGTASCRVLLAFIAIYVGLAVMRAPSEVTIERSRHAEAITFLQEFLRSYRAAGGAVLAVRPHGGSELYPRGVVLKGEVLAAFVRAPVGGVFVVHTTSPESNPLAGFYGYPPIFLGGTYFHLERKFNFSLYRCSYLIRKDSERAGVILLSRVDRAL